MPIAGCSALIGLKDPPPDVDAGFDASIDGGDATTSDAPGDVANDALDGSNDPQHCGVADRICPSGKCVLGDCVRRVFVTSATHTADVGGVPLANLAYCGPTTAITTLFPNTSFFVWLSDTDASVRDTFQTTLAPFVLPDGTPVANDWNGFLNPNSGGLLHPINMTEDGGDGSGFYVWTGTGAGGYKYDGGSIECMDWHTETGQDAVVGTTDASDTAWTNLGTAGCSTQAHFYCIER